VQCRFSRGERQATSVSLTHWKKPKNPAALPAGGKFRIDHGGDPTADRPPGQAESAIGPD
jgi:hypothetical protein